MRCSLFHRRKLFLFSTVLVLVFLCAYLRYRVPSGSENGRRLHSPRKPIASTAELREVVIERETKRVTTSPTSISTKNNELTRLLKYLSTIEHLTYPVGEAHHVVVKPSSQSSQRNIVLFREHLADIGFQLVPLGSGKDGWSVLLCFSPGNGASCLAKDRFVQLKDYQRVSFIPGMDEALLRNDGFCYTVTAARQISSSILQPLSTPCYVLPGQRASFTDSREAKSLFWMKKPYGGDASSQDAWDIAAATFADIRKLDGQAVIHSLPVDPLKVAGKAVVVQVYVLVMSVTPLRLYRHQEGSALVHSVNEVHPEVWALPKLTKHLTSLFGEQMATEAWQGLDAAIVKTLLIVEFTLLSHFHSLSPTYRCPHCFQLLTFSFMFDSTLRPFVMEVKDAVRGDIPSGVVRDTVRLLLQTGPVAGDLLDTLDAFKDAVGIEKFACRSGHKSCLDEAHLKFLTRLLTERQQQGAFNKLYPSADGEQYTALLSELRSAGDVTSMGPDDARHTTSGMHAVLTAMERYKFFKIDGKGNAANSEQFWVGTSSKDKTAKFDAETKLLELRVEPAVLSPKFSSSTRSYQATVPFETMVITLWGRTSTCTSEARLGSLDGPSKPSNTSVGVGWNQFQFLVVDLSTAAEKILTVYKVDVFRQRRHENEKEFVENIDHQVCRLVQDCDLRVFPSVPCGLEAMRQNSWKAFAESHSSLPACKSGHDEGRWVLPCDRCAESRSCYWRNALWAPYSCRHPSVGKTELRSCMANRKVLFVGDSTNRGMMYYLMEKLNGSLKSWEKTHSMKVYSNQLNSTGTSISFAYYPQFWLPSNQKPGFVRALYQLIARFLPLENSNRTVLVMGGVHWLGSDHIKDTKTALNSLGLNNIKVIVKTSGAGFHMSIPGIKYNDLEEQRIIAKRNDELIRTVDSFGYDALDTFRLTVSRYKEFLAGKCGCHFHKVIDRHSKLKEDEVTSQRNSTWHSQSGSLASRYHVIGPINSVYSEILLGRLCS